MKTEVPSVPSAIGGAAAARRGRLVNAVLTAALGLALLALLGAAVTFAQPAGPADQAHGYVIVQFNDRDLVARAITFTAPISGLRALELSGLEIVTTTTAFGPVVCSIEGVGCPAENCFCGGATFWGYKSWDGDAWQDYMVGASDSLLNDGAVEGWRWGAWGSAMWPARPVTAALRALDWLRPRQSLSDGGYGGDSGSVEALLSIGANGHAAADWRQQSDAPSLASYWLGRASPYSRAGGAQAGKLAVGMAATGTCWPRPAVHPDAYYSPTSGIYAEGAGPQAWAILGAAALSQTVPTEALQYLKSLAQPNGGWEWGPGWGTDTNTTALALQALIATGEPVTSAVVTQGLAYLKTAQNADGGFPYDPVSPWGTSSDANSTAYVLQALRAAGEDPASPAWSQGANNPITFLLGLQLADGSLEWKAGNGSNQLATQQAVVALLGRPFPLRVAQAMWCPALYLPSVSR
jgi:hypothetical protein